MIIESVNVLKLHKEFVLADIRPHPVSDLGGDNGEFIFEDGTDLQLVQQIINAHDPTPIPQPPTLEEQMIEKDKQIQMLQAQLQASTDRADFQEEVLTEIIMALNA